LTGKTPKSTDVAATLGWSPEKYHRTLRDAAMISLLSLDDPESAERELRNDIDDSTNPANKLEVGERRRMVAAAIDALPEKERRQSGSYRN